MPRKSALPPEPEAEPTAPASFQEEAEFDPEPRPPYRGNGHPAAQGRSMPEPPPPAWTPQPPGYPYSGAQVPEQPWARPPPLASGVTQDARQFTVHLLENGVPRELGRISVDATADDLLTRWPFSGTYWLYPIDMHGEICPGYERKPVVRNYSPEHEALRRAQAHAGGTALGAAPGGINISELVQAVVAPMQSQFQLLKEELTFARTEQARFAEAMSKEREEVARERLSMAVSTRADVTELHTATTNQVMAMFQAQQEHARQMHDQMLTRMREETAAERTRVAAMQQQERDRLAAERERERQWEDRRRADEEKAHQARMHSEREEAQRREQEREHAFERQLKHDAEHHERTLALMKAQNEGQDLGVQIKKLAEGAVGLAATLGINLEGVDLGAMLKRAFGGGDETVLGTISGVIEKVADTAVKMKQIEAENADEDEGEEDPEILVQAPNGQQVRMRQSQLLALQQQAAAGQIPQNQQQQQPQAPKGPALPADQLKLGRKTIRALVDKIKAAPQPEWPAVLEASIVEHVANLLPYITAVGVRQALREGGADDNLAASLLILIDNSGKIPPSVPR